MKASDLLFNDFSVMESILSETKIPQMFKVRQVFKDERIGEVYQETSRKLDESKVSSMLHPGMNICITASSRRVDQQRQILKSIVDFVKANQCTPFVIPAMGSHGGATAEGQKAILTEYGITEDFLGCPIKASMETVRLGYVEDEGKKLEVMIDRYASEADGIIVFGKI